MFDSTDVWVGRRFGSYQVEDVLGKGTTATVYRAYRLGDGPPLEVALKVLNPFAMANSSIVAMFEAEAELLGRLDHPNIVAVHGAGEVAGSFFMATDLHEGGTAWDRVTPDKKMTEVETLRLGKEIADALDHVHQNDIVHRDVKPSNILAAGVGAVLFDFGLALDLRGPAPPAGRVFGSPLFISPEQALGQPVDGRADLYGLGVTMYRLASGKAPWYGERAQLLDAHVNDTPPDPADLGVSRELAEVILHLMRKDPADRPQTGADLVRALVEIEPAVHEAAAAAPQGRKRRWFGR